MLNKQRFQERSARQEQRIYELQQRQQQLLPASSLSPQETAELDGLTSKALFVEQYDPSSFSNEHVQFKQQHNAIFRQLCHYCHCGALLREEETDDVDDDDGDEEEKNTIRNIFFLDGPDAGTASVLLAKEAFTSSTSMRTISLEHCYVANRHASTCDALKGWGLTHVAHMGAADALRNDFGNVSFGAFYFDGCGGHPPIIMDMIHAAIQTTTTTTNGKANKTQHTNIQPPIVIGFSLVGGNRDVVNKELAILRSLVDLVKPLGWRVDHVLQDCERYGMSADILVAKVDGNTLTTWVVLEMEHQRQS